MSVVVKPTLNVDVETLPAVSFAAVIKVITQRFSLRDVSDNGCKEDFTTTRRLVLVSPDLFVTNFDFQA